MAWTLSHMPAPRTKDARARVLSASVRGEARKSLLRSNKTRARIIAVFARDTDTLLQMAGFSHGAHRRSAPTRSLRRTPHRLTWCVVDVVVASLMRQQMQRPDIFFIGEKKRQIRCKTNILESAMRVGTNHEAHFVRFQLDTGRVVAFL